MSADQTDALDPLANLQPTVTLDERGSRCPIPVIALGKAARTLLLSHGVAGLREQVVIELLADDPATRSDVPAWCRMQRARVVSEEAMPDETGWRFVIALSPSEADQGPRDADRAESS
jgi:tRNA 2-thiouridine synthesizing protein A